MKYQILPALLLFGTIATAQTPTTTTTPDRIEVTIIRTSTLKIEEAWLNVALAAPGNATLESVVKAVESVGIKESDLQGIQPFYGPPPLAGPQPGTRVVYNFNFRVPSAQLSATLQKLEQLRRQLLAGETGLELVGQNVIGFGASQRAHDAARGQLTTEAIADARTRADALAKAGGLQLGAIVGVTELPYGYISGPYSAPALVTSVNITVRFATSR